MLANSTRVFHEHVTGIGAMNARVATQTRLALRRLCVLWYSRQASCGIRRGQVALQADLVHIGLNQQLVIRPPMREVAESATCSLDGRVDIDEGTGRRRVTFSTHDELPGGSTQCVFF